MDHDIFTILVCFSIAANSFFASIKYIGSHLCQLDENLYSIWGT